MTPDGFHVHVNVYLGIDVSSPLQGLRWVWLTCSSLGTLSYPSWGLKECLDFPQYFSTTHNCCDHSNIIESDLKKSPASPHRAHGGIWSGPMDLCVSSLPWLVRLPPRVHLPCSTLPPVSGVWDSWRLVLILKTEAKKAFSTSALPFVTMSPAQFSSRPIFSLLLRCSWKPFLLHLTSLVKLNSWLS